MPRREATTVGQIIREAKSEGFVDVTETHRLHTLPGARTFQSKKIPGISITLTGDDSRILTTEESTLRHLISLGAEKAH